MSENRFENFQFGIFAPVRSEEVPYKKKSQIAKDVHDARKKGMTYGQYIAWKNSQERNKEK